MTPILRLACPADAGDMLAVYAPYIRETAITFEGDVPPVEEFARRVAGVLDRLPWLACEEDGKVIGYAYGKRHRDRQAYQWSAETSIYIAEGVRRRGVGRALYRALLDILRLQGFYNAYAGITLPNDASVGFHESFGFRLVGIYRSVGYKRGAWRDVSWWHLRLAELPDDPSPPRPLAEVLDSEALRRILDAAGEGLERR